MVKKYKNFFGVVTFPDDSDPRWIPSQVPITPELAQNAMPIGTVFHPSGYAYMHDMNLWKQIRDNREQLFQQQRQIIYERQLEEDRLKKIEEKKAKEEYNNLLRQQKEIQDKIQKLQSNYEREVRKITREVDAKYNPEINKLQKELNKVNKVLR